jgi:hypothetical protein
MPIQMNGNRGRGHAAVHCDWCGEPIVDRRAGNLQWRKSEEPAAKVYYTHKRCCYAFETANGGRLAVESQDVV